MVARWQGISIDAPFLDELQDAVSTANDGISTANEAIETAQQILNALSSLTVQFTGPYQALILGALQILEDLLEEFSQPNTIHTINIPASSLKDTEEDIEQIQNVVGNIGDVDPENSEEYRRRLRRAQNVLSNTFDIVPNVDATTLNRGYVEGAVQVNEYLRNNEGRTGKSGNVRIFTELYKSLFDPGDPDRPQFQNEDTVAGFLIVYGSENPIETLKQALYASNIFDQVSQIPATRDIPVPQNVKGRLIGARSARASEQAEKKTIEKERRSGEQTYSFYATTFIDKREEYSVKLRWNSPIDQSVLDFADQIEVESIHIFHKKGSRIQPEDVDVDQRPDNLKVSVVELGDVSDIVNVLSQVQQATVPGIKLEDTDHYFAVAYSVTLEKSVRRDGNIETFRDTIEPVFSSLSNQVRINPAEKAGGSKASKGTPPDWNMSPTPVFIPGLQDTLTEIETVVENVQDIQGDIRNEYQDLIRLLGNDLETIQESLDTISQQLRRIAYLYDLLEGGVWIGTFQGKGGQQRIIESYGELLMNPGDDGPPFTRGNEFVGALSIVTGTSIDPGNIDSVLALMEDLL